MIYRKLASVLVFTMLLLGFTGHTTVIHGAPAGKASVSIQVVSSDGDPISYSGEVTLTSSALPFPLTVTADTYGVAKFPNLLPADYTVSVSAPGYAPVSSFQTGLVASGQAFSQVITLTYDPDRKGIYSFYAYNNSNVAGKFEGTVYWSTYGHVPDNSVMKLQFLNDLNNPVEAGADISSKSSDSTQNYSAPIPLIDIPAGATRIGVTLLDSSSTVIHTKSVPIWNYSLHFPRFLKFQDTNQNGGAINAVVSWLGAKDETSLAGYNIYYRVKGSYSWLYWDSVSKHEENTYDYSFSALPAGAYSIQISSVNSAGEVFPGYPTLPVIDSRLSDTIGPNLYSASLPAPTIKYDYTYAPELKKITGSFSFTTPSDKSKIQGYNLYFSHKNGVKLKAIGTILAGNDFDTQLDYILPDSLDVPANAAQLALYSYGIDGTESAPVYLPIKHFNRGWSGSKIPNGATYLDLNERPNYLSGFIRWNRASDESDLASYPIYFLNNNEDIISQIGEVSKINATEFKLPADLTIPDDATLIGIGARNKDGGVSSNFFTVPLTDNQTQDQVKAAARAAFFPGTGPLDIGSVVGFLRQYPSTPLFEKKDMQLLLSLIDPSNAPE